MYKNEWRNQPIIINDTVNVRYDSFYNYVDLRCGTGLAGSIVRVQLNKEGVGSGGLLELIKESADKLDYVYLEKSILEEKENG